MKELPAFDLIAFILPPATALVGMRLSRWILGEKFEAQFGFGFRFTFGLAIGMLFFTQAVLACALAGVNGAPLLAWAAIFGGIAELIVQSMKLPGIFKSLKFQPGHLWLLLLLPLLYSWWIFGQLSTLEGTMEFDANAFWVFKAKILFLTQGRELIHVLQHPNLAYMHMDYPMLVPCLYTFGYGAVGGVDEFVNKVWPFWMVVTLCMAILSFARVWQNPRPLPIVVVLLIAFLPATFEFIRNEGGTIPMVFCINLATLLIVRAIIEDNDVLPPAIILAFTVCFSTKLEGAVYAAICTLALLPFCLRRGWLKNKLVWRSAVIAAVSLLPYVFYRLGKPVAHPESHWVHVFTSNPQPVLHHFPQALFMNIFARFFSPQFFLWQPDNDHLHWAGQWGGVGSLVNTELFILPWLLLALLIVTAIFKPRGRTALVFLSGITLGLFTFLSFVIVCLPNCDLTEVIDLACRVSGRHYYPFLVAWFLGIAALWFFDEKGLSALPAEPEKKPGLSPPKPKRLP